jgi:hypothetical protein
VRETTNLRQMSVNNLLTVLGDYKCTAVQYSTVQYDINTTSEERSEEKSVHKDTFKSQ